MLLALLCLLQLTPTPARPPRPALVYLCQGRSSYAYHRLPSCEELAWCSTRLRTVPAATAQKEGRYPCARCRPAR